MIRMAFNGNITSKINRLKYRFKQVNDNEEPYHLTRHDHMA